jgi:hypothetical protein
MCGGGCSSVWMWEAYCVVSRRLLCDCTAAMRPCSLQASTQGSGGVCASIGMREPASMSVHISQGQDPLTVSLAGTSLVRVVHSLPPILIIWIEQFSFLVCVLCCFISWGMLVLCLGSFIIHSDQCTNLYLVVCFLWLYMKATQVIDELQLLCSNEVYMCHYICMI